MKNYQEKLLGLDLFSGIGGITLGLQKWVVPIAYCETDRHAQGVLLSRMSDGQLPLAPIWDDVKTLKGKSLPVKPDIIYGGFPCTDISICNLSGKGLEGERSGLFYEICRLAEEIRPTFLFLENVPNIRSRGLWRVGKELSDLGYDCRWGVLAASAVGAPHQRKRWFCLGHSNSKGLEGPGLHSRDGRTISQASEPRSDAPMRLPIWDKSDTEVLRIPDGVSSRMDRIKELGNAVVPKQVEEAFKRLIGFK